MTTPPIAVSQSLTGPAPVRVRAYVDGFNFYHGLMEHSKAREFRWVDLKGLVQHFLRTGETLEAVTFFTSIPFWDLAKAKRHRTYVDALASTGVVTCEGRFQPKETICRAMCGQMYYLHEEKLTDVQISTSVITDSLQDLFDVAVLVTGDADQAPTIRALRTIAPKKQVRCLFPPRRQSAELSQLVGAKNVDGPINGRTVKACQLAETITLPGRVIQKPAGW